MMPSMVLMYVVFIYQSILNNSAWEIAKHFQKDCYGEEFRILAIVMYYDVLLCHSRCFAYFYQFLIIINLKFDF